MPDKHIRIRLAVIVLLCAQNACAADPGLGGTRHGYDLEAVHKEVFRHVVGKIGLSSTGTVEYVTSHVVATDIKDFAKAGDVVFEYRTTHLFDRTLALFWYNPKTRGHLLLVNGGSGAGNAKLAYAPDADTLRSIAREIESLKREYPQLEDFSARINVDVVAKQISYSYRTHKAEPRGGWTAGVPNPDKDGVWFYVDFHDPASTAQIHTQPAAVARHCLGDSAVTFLSLNGSQTARIDGPIWRILEKHGVAECAR